MSTLVTEDGTTVTIALAGPPTARLFGLPFLLVGVYLLLQWLGGVADIVRGRAALGEMAIGTVLLLLIALAFLVPGWVLTLGRSLVTLDTAAQTVTTVRDLRVYRHRETRTLTEFDRVEVAHLSVGTNTTSGSRRAQYQVELAGERGANVVVGLFEDDGDAVAFGRSLSQRLGLPVRDRRADERH
ncbi:MAG: hypothetical protein JNM38_12870 [Acidobacteria bacterium]|nr:hypothetical protein [Acidobacteriota bacterium]